MGNSASTPLGERTTTSSTRCQLATSSGRRPRPSRSRSAPVVRPSPQTLSRGNVALWASVMAAAVPAGPAPTTATSRGSTSATVVPAAARPTARRRPRPPGREVDRACRATGPYPRRMASSVTPSAAQALWSAAEGVHAVCYFDRGVRRAIRAAGAPGFWAGYFGTRLAPLRTSDPWLAASVLYVFARPMVAEHLPAPEDGAGWDAARRVAVRDALAGLGPGDPAWAAAADHVRALAKAADPAGRPLFAAHAGLPWPDDPVTATWHGCTLLREYRGDGHTHVLAGEGLSGCAAMLLALRWRGHGAGADASTADDRGWSADEIAAA